MRIPKVSFFADRAFHFMTHLFIFSMILAVSTPSLSQEPLQLGVHPFLVYTQIEKKFSPLAAYLSNQIGRPVVVRVSSSYQEHLDAVGRDQLDIAYIGPAEYVFMVKKYGPKPLIACQETDGLPFFRGIIVVRDDCPATSLAELGKGEFAFVNQHSTMGYRIPLIMLQKENPLLITDQRYRFLKTHDNVALGVLVGDFEAGAVKEAVYQKFKSRGLKMLTATPIIAEHLFVARSTLAETTVKQLRTAMLKLKGSPGGANVLQSIKASLTGFTPATDDAYNSLRQILDHQE